MLTLASERVLEYVQSSELAPPPTSPLDPGGDTLTCGGGGGGEQIQTTGHGQGTLALCILCALARTNNEILLSGSRSYCTWSHGN
jgi:hypothetical protein